MKLFYAETGCGACLKLARNEESAYRKILEEVGTINGISKIREATQKDAEHVRAMGGIVPAMPNIETTILPLTESEN